ncbi:MAG: dihydropteroate synthase [Candidatus Zipacnadales bacterium]
MAEHYARVLDPRGFEDALKEIVGVKATRVAARWMANKATLRAVRLEGVSGRAASLLKQEALAVGAECAVARSVAAFDDTPQSVVLIANLQQHRALARKLKAQPFGLYALSQQVQQALQAYDATRSYTLQIGRHQLAVGQRTLVMGILNVTPDSFSGDGLGNDVAAAVERAKQFARDGADILDVGGQSTRPGSEEVDLEEEQRRVLPVIRALVNEVDLPISIDTDKTEVSCAALDAGAGLINDVRGLRRPGMVELIAERGVPACIMHMLGSPRTMQEAPYYEDVVADIYRFLAERVQACMETGISREQLIIDPGIGFGKTVEHNLTILRRLREFRSLGCAILVGVSRKSMIGKVLDLPPEERMEGTAAACACAIYNGADIIRVHDVREMVRVARMTDAIVKGAAET